MTIAPQNLTDLSTFWKAHGGVPLGIVGNQKHCSGYHLGKDRIFGSCACRPDGTCVPGIGSRDYSVQIRRDKAGLSNAASAIDLGRLDGSLAGLRSFSKWLVRQCQDHPKAYRDIREIIYSPDGRTVQRFSGEDGTIHTGPGNGDSSHTTHTHISFYRDSTGRDMRPLFAPYFAPSVPLPDTSTGADMPALAKYLPGHTITIKATSNVRSAPTLAAKVLRAASAKEVWTVVGTVVGDKDVDGACSTTTWYVRWSAGWEYTSGCNVVAGPTAPVSDCAPAVKAATDPLNAQVASLTSQLAAAQAAATTAAANEKDRIAKAAGAAETARIRGL